MSLHISRRRHLLHAAWIWMLVGVMLCVRGAWWVLADNMTHRFFLVILLFALAAGMLKGTWVLKKSAARTTARIRQLDEQTPFWHLYSPGTYLLILGMMALGIACRWVGKEWHLSGIVGVLYLVIGIALLTGSRAYRDPAEPG